MGGGGFAFVYSTVERDSSTVPFKIINHRRRVNRDESAQVEAR